MASTITSTASGTQGVLDFSGDPGASASVGAADTGRLWYNQTTARFQTSLNGAAFTNVAIASDLAWLSSSGVTSLATATDQVAIGTSSAATNRSLTLRKNGTRVGITLQDAATTDVIAANYTVNADANPTWSVLGSGATYLGAGGASAQDIRTYRASTKTWVLDDTAGTNAEFLVDLTASSTGTMVNIYKSTSATNTVVPMLISVLGSTGVAAAGLGASLDFQLENSSGFSTLSGRISCVVTTTTAGSENSDLRFIMQTGATSGTEKWRMQGSDGALLMMTNASIIPNTDSQGAVGTSAKRFASNVANAHNVYAAASDAQVSTTLTSGSLVFGVGGATLPDTRIRRSAASQITLDNNAGTSGANLIPGTTNTGSLGTSTQVWSSLYTRALIGSGQVTLAATVFTAAATITTSDAVFIARCDPSTASFALTLPAAASSGGRILWVINNGYASANTVTVTPAGADTVNNAATYVLNAGQSIQLAANALTGNWELF